MGILNRWTLDENDSSTFDDSYEFFGAMLMVFISVTLFSWALSVVDYRFWIGMIAVSTVASLILSIFNYTRRGYAKVWHFVKFLLRSILFVPAIFVGGIYLLSYWFLYFVDNYIISMIKSVLNYKIIGED